MLLTIYTIDYLFASLLNFFYFVAFLFKFFHIDLAQTLASFPSASFAIAVFLFLFDISLIILIEAELH